MWQLSGDQLNWKACDKKRLTENAHRAITWTEREKLIDTKLVEIVFSSSFSSVLADAAHFRARESRVCDCVDKKHYKADEIFICFSHATFWSRGNIPSEPLVISCVLQFERFFGGIIWSTDMYDRIFRCEFIAAHSHFIAQSVIIINYFVAYSTLWARFRWINWMA